MSGIFAELNRRNVTRVAIAYAVASWVLTEVSSVLLPTFGAPEWVLQVLVALLILGFPVALVIAWVYELTPEGIKRESEIQRGESISGQTGRKLNLVVISLLLIAIALLVTNRFIPGTSTSPAPSTTVQQDGAEKQPVESIAVLAFSNMSTDEENEYFAEGISEEILNLLAAVKGLSVASRTSAFAFKGKEEAIPDIAKALQVRYVLEGSVRKSGRQVRVTAQLIDAQSDRHLWSETYDRSLEDIFKIQDEIAGAIGTELQVQLLGDSGTSVQSTEIDPDMYAQFLEARYRLRSRKPEEIRSAIEQLIIVLGREPGFAKAHVVLGEAYLLQHPSKRFVSAEFSNHLGRMHAGIAQSIDPRLGGIDLILGNLAENERRPAEAIRHYNRAIELEPGEPRPYHWRGLTLANFGYLDECKQDLQQAAALEPENPNIQFALSGCLFAAGQQALATTHNQQGLDLGNTGGYTQLVYNTFMSGNQQAGLKLIDQLIEFGANRTLWRYVEARLTGQTESVDVLLTPDIVADWDYPMAVIVLGEKEILFDYLSKESFLGRTMTGLWAPNLSEWRSDPRFVTTMTRFGALDLWRNEGLPPDCVEENGQVRCGLISDAP